MGVKISDLTSATSLTGSEELPIVQEGNTKKTTIQQVKAQNYSTTEQVVGTWIDGKPLYRKVIEEESVTLSGGYGTLSATIANVDNLCFYFYSVGTPSTVGKASRQGYLNTNYYNGLQTSSVNTTDLQFIVYAKDGTNTAVKFRGVFWYTKTTDTATQTRSANLTMNTGSLVGSGDKAEINIDEKTMNEIDDETIEEKTPEENSGNETIQEENKEKESGDVK